MKNQTLSALCLSIVGLLVVGASLKAPVMKPVDHVLNKGSKAVSEVVRNLPGGQ